jgi:hypothetical protein
MHFYICLITTIFITVNVFSQNQIVTTDTVNIKDYSNIFLLNGKIGHKFIVKSIDSTDFVIVHWKNGYFSIGTIKEGRETGKWYIYDRKLRLREYLLFGPDANCILYSKKTDKKGKIIKEIKTLTPCF